MKLVIICVLLDGLLAADLDFLRSTITDHFSANRHHVANPANKRAVRDFIEAQFAAYGFETELQTFTSLPSNTTFKNVIGIKKGSNYNTAEDRVVGLGAHYDTVDTTPGVDDNGSGMAAMLHVMKHFHETGGNYENTMMFVAFDGEEHGFLGSEKFVNDWWAPFIQNSLSKNHSGFIILDTIMDYNTSRDSQNLPPRFDLAFPAQAARIKLNKNTGDFITSIYRGVGDVGDVVLANTFNTSWRSGEQGEFKIESFGIPTADSNVIKYIYGHFVRSDHWSFWQAGFPAIFLTDTADFRGKMIECYHNPCDQLPTMLTDDNIRFLGKTTDSLITTMDTLAVREKSDTSMSPKSTCSIGTLVLVVLCTFYTVYGQFM